MRRALLTLALGALLVVLVPAAPAPADNAYVIYAAQGESSAVKLVAELPLVLDPSIGYALSENDQTPTSRGRASMVEPGLVGRVAMYFYLKMVQVPYSAECAFPDPPGPLKDDQTLTRPSGSIGAGVSTCQSDERPGNVSRASVLEGSVGEGLIFTGLHASSETGLAGEAVAASTSATIAGLSVGGVLTIDEILSSAKAGAGENEGKEEATSSITITGAKVQGQAVEITHDGVKVGGTPTGGRKEAQQLVDQALASSGVTVRLLEAERQAGSGDAQASSGGLLVSWGSDQAEKRFSVILGLSSATVSYHTQPGFELGVSDALGDASPFSTEPTLDAVGASSDSQPGPEPGLSTAPLAPESAGVAPGQALAPSSVEPALEAGAAAPPGHPRAAPGEQRPGGALIALNARESRKVAGSYLLAVALVLGGFFMLVVASRLPMGPGSGGRQ